MAAPSDQQHTWSPHRDGEPLADDQLAREIRTACTQLRQTVNGLHHLVTAIPSLERSVETVIALLTKLANALDRRG